MVSAGDPESSGAPPPDCVDGVSDRSLLVLEIGHVTLHRHEGGRFATGHSCKGSRWILGSHAGSPYGSERDVRRDQYGRRRLWIAPASDPQRQRLLWVSPHQV